MPEKKCFKIHNRKTPIQPPNPSELEKIFSGQKPCANSIFVFNGTKWQLNDLDALIRTRIPKTAFSGDSGPTGPIGEIGPRGTPGVQGFRGLPGPQGLEGPLGPRGPIGVSGHIGPTGPTGSRGIPGQAGLPGGVGSPGGIGPVGNAGATGPSGSMGLQGPIGPRGPAGPIGPTGYIHIGDIKLESLKIDLDRNNQIIGTHSVHMGCGIGDPSAESVCIGYRAGTVPSGGYSTHVGCEAGQYSSGRQNTYIGNGVCAKTGSDGSYNLCAGAEAGFNNTIGSGNVFLGAAAGSSNTDGSWNVFVGQSAGQSNEIGTSNVFLGPNSGSTSVAGNGCICIGDGADTSNDIPVNQLVFGQGVVSYGDNTLTFPKNLRTLPNGTEVNFSSAGGGCLYPVSSSIRWKENVQDIHALVDTSLVYNLRPVTFNPATGYGNPRETHIGLIAEEVDKVLPLIVPKDDTGRPSSVRYSILSVVLLAELQKMRKQFDTELAILKRNIADIK